MNNAFPKFYSCFFILSFRELTCSEIVIKLRKCADTEIFQLNCLKNMMKENEGENGKNISSFDNSSFAKSQKIKNK